MSARTKTNNMSDTVPSGEPTSAPATPGAATPAAPAAEAAPTGTFGQTRGSGLARGKRPQPQSASTAKAPVASGDYKPSALEVIKPQSEYKNPFTGETSVPTPAPEPVAPESIAPESIATPAPVAPAAETPAVTTPAAPVAPTAAPEALASEPEQKAELNILPPAETKRPAVSWGESPADNAAPQRREERGTFRPERREQKPFEPRQPREPREPRENREPRREQTPNLEPRAQQSREFRPSNQPVAEKNSGGFLGWLKGLFGGKTEESPAAGQSERREGEHQHHRRRHRGGRGRGGFQGENRGPRPEGQQGGGFQPREGREGGQGGEGNFEGGGRRRRRRGGRGRNRDDRGPRPEGHQGGGAI